MANEMITKKFTLKYSELIFECNTKHVFMERDVAQFTLFGVTQLIIDDFEEAIDEFEALPTDTELEAISKQATEDKNTIREEIMPMLKAMYTRAKLSFPNTDARIKLFYIENMALQRDIDILYSARQVARSAQLHLAAMAVSGLTQGMITELTTKCQEFEDAMDAQQNAQANRENATQNRVTKANDLYDLLSKYCDIGKTIWDGTDPAKYNDYLLYPNQGETAPAKTRTLRYEIDRFKWDINAKATSYEFQRKYIGHPIGDWEMVATPSNNFVIMPPIHGPNEYRVRGVNNIGAGDWSDVHFFDGGQFNPVQIINSVFEPDNGIHNDQVKVTWEKPNDANAVEIWRARENGQYNVPPPNPFELIATTNEEEYIDDMSEGDGNMFYYYAIAKYGTNNSNPSQISWVNTNINQ